MIYYLSCLAKRPQNSRSGGVAQPGERRVRGRGSWMPRPRRRLVRMQALVHVPALDGAARAVGGRRTVGGLHRPQDAHNAARHACRPAVRAARPAPLRFGLDVRRASPYRDSCGGVS